MQLTLTPLLTVALLLPGDDPFRSLDFDTALATAKKEQKVVMIDFFTTWCEPCKRLDKTTWKDEGVVAWLRQNTVPLKIDAEKQVELADRFQIRSYPTMLFVRPDASELDRLVGYRSPSAFLSEAADALAGRDAVDRAREALVGSENNPMLRSSLAGALVHKGRYEEALKEYLWCYDHGLEHRPSYVGVRSSFLLSYIIQLGRVYPPAMEALEHRAEEGGKAILDGTGRDRSLDDFITLNEKLGQKERTLALFDEIKETEDRRAVREAMVEAIADLLVKEQRYKDVVLYAPNMSDWFRSQRSYMDRFKDADGNLAGMEAHLRSRILVQSGHYYEALAGAGSLPDLNQPSVDEFESLILALDSTGRTYARLIKHAVLAGAHERARSLAGRAEAALKDEKDLKRVRRAARKIPEDA